MLSMFFLRTGRKKRKMLSVFFVEFLLRTGQNAVHFAGSTSSLEQERMLSIFFVELFLKNRAKCCPFFGRTFSSEQD